VSAILTVDVAPSGALLTVSPSFALLHPPVERKASRLAIPLIEIHVFSFKVASILSLLSNQAGWA
jgi:hypothetical protein